MAKVDPPMHIKIHFLNFFYFLCIGPKIVTPRIPLIIGDPPTAVTASGRSFAPNQGLSKKDRIMEIPLKIPKKHPKAMSKNM